MNYTKLCDNTMHHNESLPLVGLLGEAKGATTSVVAMVVMNGLTVRPTGEI